MWWVKETDREGLTLAVLWIHLCAVWARSLLWFRKRTFLCVEASMQLKAVGFPSETVRPCLLREIHHCKRAGQRGVKASPYLIISSHLMLYLVMPT